MRTLLKFSPPWILIPETGSDVIFLTKSHYYGRNKKIVYESVLFFWLTDHTRSQESSETSSNYMTANSDESDSEIRPYEYTVSPLASAEAIVAYGQSYICTNGGSRDAINA